MEAQPWELVYGEKGQSGAPADCLNFPSPCWVFVSPRFGVVAFNHSGYSSHLLGVVNVSDNAYAIC